jgi:cysteine desulfurase
MISIGLVNNEIGVIQDLSALRRAAGSALLHCDAAQAPEAMAMSKTSDQCDMMSLSAHKMRGPMGIGAIYIARHAQSQVAPILHGGGQQGGIRPGTLPVHLCVGMGAACRLAARNVDERSRIASLRREFLLRLGELGLPFELNGPSDFSRRHPGNANLRLPGVDAEQLIALLQPGLAISTGSACTSGTMEPSHVLTALGLDHDEASSSLRVSIGYRNTVDEVGAAAQMLFDAHRRIV